MIYRFLPTLLLLSAWATVATAQKPREVDHLLLHDRSVTTDSVVRWLQDRKIRIVDSSSFFSIVTVRIDPALGPGIRQEAWVWALDSLPELETINDKSRAVIGVDHALAAPYSTIANPYNLTGTGVNVGIWDAAAASPHNDYSARLHVMETSTAHAHANHVTGTVAGNGISSVPSHTYAGMAPECEVYSWDFAGSPYQEVANGVLNQQIVISQNSWGFVVNSGNCSMHGAYHTYSNAYDNLVRNHNLSVFFAVGNQRGYPATMTACGIPGGFASVPPPATAKNVVSVGAVDHLSAMSSFSSWGPVRDGRLKPDCVADGVNIRSTGLNMTDYSQMSGTSMACPAVSGSGALLIQRYRQKNAGVTPRPDVLKNIMLNSCRDLGNPGPDYRFGYGAIDVPTAARMIDDNRIHTGAVAATGTVDQFPLNVTTSCPLRVMLVYSDIPGNPSAQKALINDLDLELVAPDGTVYLPLTLDKSAPNADAVPLVNRLDNVEQVVLHSPMSGMWTVRVRGFALDAVAGQQLYSVTWDQAGECPDLYMKDSPVDIGVEPNTQTGPVLWASEDIWVTQANNSSLSHSNPQYGTDNWVFVRVRNRGQVQGSATVRLYWAKAATNLGWPTNWNGSTSCCNGAVCGGEIAPVSSSLVTVAPSGDQIMAFKWDPPNPADYASCFVPGEVHHFCLLARLETVPYATYGLTYPETPWVGLNTKNNNGIAWKNVSVVGLNGESMRTAVLMRGGARRSDRISLRFSLPKGASPRSFFDNGSVTVRLGPKLFQQWRRAGGQGLVSASDEQASTVTLNRDNAWIGGLALDSHEVAPVTVTFAFDKQTPKDSATFVVDMVQFGAGEDSSASDGGERFVIHYAGPSSAASAPEISGAVDLMQNHPNPVRRETTIGFTTATGGMARLVLCDMLGREIRVLAEERYEAGEHAISCRLDDLPSGTYLYRLTVGGTTATRSLTVTQ